MSLSRNKFKAEWHHRWAQPRLSAYLEGDLSPRQRRRLHAHESICPECRRALERLKTLLRSLPMLRGREPGADAVAERTAEAVRRRIDAESAADAGRAEP